MDSATLLLTILSVLLAWGFLTALVAGLLIILKSLQSVRGSLEQIAMGVRAIRHQVRPFGTSAAGTAEGISMAEASLARLARRMAGAREGVGNGSGAGAAGGPAGEVRGRER